MLLPLVITLGMVSNSQLINELGNDDFRVREEATKQLLIRGAGKIRVLEAAYLTNEDPEIRRRSETILYDYFDLGSEDQFVTILVLVKTQLNSDSKIQN